MMDREGYIDLAWHEMDNIQDMDTTLWDYAEAVIDRFIDEGYLKVQE